MIRAKGVLQVFRGRLKRSVCFGLLILGLKREAQVDIDVTQDARKRLRLTGRLQKPNRPRRIGCGFVNATAQQRSRGSAIVQERQNACALPSGLHGRFTYRQSLIRKPQGRVIITSRKSK